MKGRVIIVGGGVMGLSVALHTARGCDPLREPVILLERKTLGAGSSGRSGAILRQFYSDRVVAGMARDSLKVFAALQRHTGRSVGFRQTGVLTIAGSREAQLVRDNVEMMQSIGIDVELVDADGMRELVPGIEVDDAAFGAWEKDAGFVDPPRTLNAFAALAREAGVTTRIGEGVTGFIRDGDRVVGVKTDHGEFFADQIVVAAGPWTRGLLAPLGVDPPLRTVRPEQHFLEMPSGGREDEFTDFSVEDDPAAADPVATRSLVEDEVAARFSRDEPQGPAPAHPVLLDMELGYYSKCEPDDMRTRVGGIDLSDDQVLEDPDTIDEQVGDEFSSWARKVLIQRLPVYADQDDLDGQAAWYTLTPDSQAIIGQVESVPGLWVVTGFSGHGFKLSPSIGEGVAQMLLGKAVSAFDPEFFSPERFAKAAGWGEKRGFGL